MTLIISEGCRIIKKTNDTLYDDLDDLNKRSVFYTAQSYMDAGDLTSQ